MRVKGLFVGLVTWALCGVAGASTVLVTGTNRGIGLEFVRQYAAQGWTVIATVRNPAAATELAALAAGNPKIRVEKLDVTDVAAVEALAAKYRGQPIDILINNAGALGDVPSKRSAPSIRRSFLR